MSRHSIACLHFIAHGYLFTVDTSSRDGGPGTANACPAPRTPDRALNTREVNTRATGTAVQGLAGNRGTWKTSLSSSLASITSQGAEENRLNSSTIIRRVRSKAYESLSDDRDGRAEGFEIFRQEFSPKIFTQTHEEHHERDRDEVSKGYARCMPTITSCWTKGWRCSRRLGARLIRPFSRT